MARRAARRRSFTSDWQRSGSRGRDGLIFTGSWGLRASLRLIWQLLVCQFAVCQFVAESFEALELLHGSAKEAFRLGLIAEELREDIGLAKQAAEAQVPAAQAHEIGAEGDKHLAQAGLFGAKAGAIPPGGEGAPPTPEGGVA